MGYFLLLLLVFFTLFTPTFALQINNCHKVYGVVGAEDISIDQQKGIAYLSSQDRRPSSLPQGNIYSLNLHAKELRPELMINNQSFTFHPHGISILKTLDDDYLYIINHPNFKPDTIEIYQIIDDKHLRHVKTLKDPLLKDLDALDVLGENEIYATNFSHHSILYFNGTHWQEVYKHIFYANGITILPDRKNVYVVSTLEKEVYHFIKDSQTGVLIKIDTFPIDMYGDNIQYDQHNNLWIAGHVSFIRFLLHQFIPIITSPSRIMVIPEDQYPQKKLLMNDYGRQISSASVAAPYDDKVLIGTVFEPYIMECDIK